MLRQHPASRKIALADRVAEFSNLPSKIFYLGRGLRLAQIIVMMTFLHGRMCLGRETTRHGLEKYIMGPSGLFDSKKVVYDRLLEVAHSDSAWLTSPFRRAASG